MNLYIQTELKGLVNRTTIQEGGQLLGYITRYASNSDIKLVPERDIAYGNVNFIYELANVNNLKIPVAGFVPDKLKEFAPPFVLTKSDDAYKAIGKFVKPSPLHQKAFNGFVVKRDRPQETMLTLAGYEGEVIIQEFVEYVSEWRFIVLDHEVLDARHYKGNFRLIPDWKLADTVADAFRGFGPAWSFDLGLTADGKTHLIECHTMFSLGCYGTPSIFMGRALAQAWDFTWQKNCNK